MTIHKVLITIADTPHRKAIVDALPALELSIGSELHLNPISVMQFVRHATAKIMENISGLYLCATEDQLVWNAYTDANKQVLMQFTGFEFVDVPCEWHIVANPLDVLQHIYFSSQAGQDSLSDHSDQIWFDCDLPNIMLKESNGDYDDEVRVSGYALYNCLTDDVQIVLTDDFMQCEKLFEFTKTKAHFMNLLGWLFAQPDFRDRDTSAEEILQEMGAALLDTA